MLQGIILNKFAKAALITVCGQWFLLMAALSSGIRWAGCAAALSLCWFLWAAFRLVQLIRIGAYRRDAPEWVREDLGFMAGVVSATPLAIAVLAAVAIVRRPSEREVAAAPKAMLEYAGRYPTAQQGFQALLTDPGVTGWSGPYAGQGVVQFFSWFKYSTGPDGKPILVPRPRRDLKTAQSPTH
jgi:hypothetical protein